MSAPTICRKRERRRSQELAFALATAEAVLDEVKNSGEVPAEDFPRVVGRI